MWRCPIVQAPLAYCFWDFVFSDIRWTAERNAARVAARA